MKQRSKQKTSMLYAESLYGAAEQLGITERVFNDVSKFAGLLDEKIDELSYLSSPIVENAEKFSMISAVCKAVGTCSEFENMLKLLAENGHFSDLNGVLSAYIGLYNAKREIAEVEVETVVSLTPEQDKALKQKLAEILQKKITVKYVINPEILGGLVVKCGTLLIDGSIKNKLDCLEQTMKGIQ